MNVMLRDSYPPKKYVTLFIILFYFGLITSLVAQEEPYTGDQHRFNATVFSGYHHEDFNWSIAGNLKGNSPNIYSELTWKDLGGPQIGVTLDWNFHTAFFIQADVTVSSITSGKVSDTDYLEDNRTHTSFYALLDSDRGTITSLEPVLGYRIIHHSTYSIAAFVGYGAHIQSLYLLDHEGQYVRGLKSSYKTIWKGLILGLEGSIQLTNRFTVAPTIRYYQVTYNSEGNWNLIDEFRHPVSYTHAAKGYGVAPKLRINYSVRNRWDVFVGTTYMHWKTGKGIDTLFLRDGRKPKTQFNGALRDAYAVHAGLNYAF